MNYNPAEEALNELLGNGEILETTPASDIDREFLIRVCRGIKIAAPLLSACMEWNTSDLHEDMDILLSEIKSLTNKIANHMESTSSEGCVDHNLIMQLVTEAIALDWKSNNEIENDWEKVLCQLITNLNFRDQSHYPGLDEQEFMINTIACTRIIHSLLIEPSIQVADSDINDCYSVLYQSVNRAIEKLTTFHIPYQSASKVRSHITEQFSQILIGIIESELRFHKEIQIKEALCEQKPERPSPFSLHNCFKKFDWATDSFSLAIFENCRVLK